MAMWDVFAPLDDIQVLKRISRPRQRDSLFTSLRRELIERSDRFSERPLLEALRKAVTDEKGIGLAGGEEEDRIVRDDCRQGETGERERGVNKPKKATKRPLEKSQKESDKLKLHVYTYIQTEHTAGKKPAAILASLKASQDRKEQVKRAGLELDSAMVKAALARPGQRERDKKRKMQDSPRA